MYFSGRDLNNYTFLNKKCMVHFLKGVSVMITGKDSISLQVLEAFTKKQKLADIAASFNLSLDQVKRLKRLYNYTNVVQELTNGQATAAFKDLGTKGLFLSPYIKAKDANALADILALTTENTTRDELLALMQQYDAKHARIQSFEQAYEDFLKQSAEKELLYQSKIVELQHEKQHLMTKYHFVKQYEPKIQELLMHYVGVHKDGYYGLRRRVNTGFRKTLQKKNIIQLNTEYIWEILLLDEFAEQLAYRLKRGFYIAYDVNRELHRMRNNERGAMFVADQEEYKAIRNYTEETEQIERSIRDLEAELTALMEEKKRLKAELEANKRASIQSFEEASIA